MDLYLDTPEPKPRPPSGQVSHFYILGDWDSTYLSKFKKIKVFNIAILVSLGDSASIPARGGFYPDGIRFVLGTTGFL
jgi:hypothetical protein